MAPRDPAEAMVIERDVPISMDDGLLIRADVYRPKAQYPVPVIMTAGPYGKGVKYQEHYKLMWEWLVEQHPEFLPVRLEASWPGKPSTRKYGCHGVTLSSAFTSEAPVVRPAIWMSSPRAKRATTIMRSSGPALAPGQAARSA